jgi:hypothetical protein
MRCDRCHAPLGEQWSVLVAGEGEYGRAFVGLDTVCGRCASVASDRGEKVRLLSQTLLRAPWRSLS